MASEILKKVKREIRSIGKLRFFIALLSICLGTLCVLQQMMGFAWDNLFAWQNVLYFLCLLLSIVGIWKLWQANYKLAFVIILIGGLLLLDAIFKGLILTKENFPWIMILGGVLLFTLPKKSLNANAYGYTYGGYRGKSRDSVSDLRQKNRRNRA
jgi:hypothetical protein